MAMYCMAWRWEKPMLVDYKSHRKITFCMFIFFSFITSSFCSSTCWKSLWPHISTMCVPHLTFLAIQGFVFPESFFIWWFSNLSNNLDKFSNLIFIGIFFFKKKCSNQLVNVLHFSSWPIFFKNCTFIQANDGNQQNRTICIKNYKFSKKI